jgi:hypothetical protein
MVPGWSQKLRVLLQPWQDRAAAEIERDLKADIAAHHFVTGELYQSIHRVGDQVKIGSDHWQFIEYGTQPHIIQVQQKRVMTDMNTFFGTRVLHPGTRAYAPVRRATYKRRRLRG